MEIQPTTLLPVRPYSFQMTVITYHQEDHSEPFSSTYLSLSEANHMNLAMSVKGTLQVRLHAF